jgi:hypothetical protein
MPFTFLSATMVVASVTGCAEAPGSGTSGGARPDMLINMPMQGGPFNAGEMGWATLVARGDRTDVTITVSGVPPEVTRPVHLYTFIHQGACGALSPQPAYSLTAIVLARSASAQPGRTGAPFTVANTAGVPLSTLKSTPHAIMVKSAPADGSRELFCGDIATPSPAR